jgi:hypothetical protein
MFDSILFQEVAEQTTGDSGVVLLKLIALMIATPSAIFVGWDSSRRGYIDDAGETHRMQPAFWAVFTFPTYFFIRKPLLPKYQK